MESDETGILHAQEEMDINYEILENYTPPTETTQKDVVDRLMPKSNLVQDFVFGPNHRLEDESFKDYRIRLKLEKYIYKLRAKNGVSRYPGDKGTFVNPEKQQRKTWNKMQKIQRKMKFRALKKENGGKKVYVDIEELI